MQNAATRDQLIRSFDRPIEDQQITSSTGPQIDHGSTSSRGHKISRIYMHDGSAATLDAVLEHYMAGGRTIASGPYQGIGHDNPNKNATIHGFTLSREQHDDLIAFLRSLTDDELLRDPRFSNPWSR